MNRSHIEQEVARILRAASLSGSDREISLADPIGELGLGLDSLALVEFVTALEKEFQIPMPDDIWTARGQLTPNHFVEIIAESNPKLLNVESSASACVLPQRSNDSLIQYRDKAKRTGSAAVRSAFKALKRLSPSDLFYIVQFKLSERPLPVYSPALKLSLRTASLDDAPALTTFWKSNPHINFNRETLTMELFEKLLASGHTCYAAWLDDEIVGQDWVWDRGFYCRNTGLRLDWPRDTCYADELSEHDRYGGKGIGLALLAFSLGESKKMGYARQVCLVYSRNLAMLNASIQLFNAEIIGSIRSWVTPLLPFSTWKIDGRAGHGGTLIL